MSDDLRNLPDHKKTTERAIAAALSVPVVYINKLKKAGLAIWHSSRLKPMLSEKHKDNRLLWCLSMIDSTTINSTRSALKYQDMYDLVHIDEKWFNLKKTKRGFILAPGEKVPERTTKHKSHIQKVQFIAALGRPHFVEETGEFFDGKIGMWPIGYWSTYQRGGSVNPKGSDKWEDEAVDLCKYYELLMDKIVPAIMAKHPFFALGKTIRIQQDGAPAHGAIGKDPRVFAKAMAELGVGEQIKLITQPAQSPDLNVCDLGFFSSIQTEYYKKCPRNVKEIHSCIDEALEEYPGDKLNRIWITLQSIMNEVIEDEGGNDYKIPHLNKDRLEREGTLPEVLDVTDAARPILEAFGEF